MYIPKQDEAFGSFCIYRMMTKHEGKIYRIERTRWKTLNTEKQRCDNENATNNTTKCITRYIEETIGCSMGMYGRDQDLKR